MYQVIIVFDETRSKNYYYSYVDKDGNIECTELPPYQDIQKARACYWDAENGLWMYDADRYAEIVAASEAQKAAAEQAQREADAVPSNKEITEALMELARNVSANMDAIVELAAIKAGQKGGE
ncbi:MAG: hypothetical protein K2P63_05735 [Lachnospiraceae bacterium]|nr:hypothetical protein [Lachnospiraceae bacterium]